MPVRALGRHDPPPGRGGPDRHQAVGSVARAAGVGRPAPGRQLPRVPQPPRVGDRPARRSAGGPDRGGRDHRRRRASSSTPASSASAAPPNGSSCPTTSWPGSRASRSLGRLGLIVHATAGLHRPGLEGHADARAQQPHARPDQALPRAADRPAVVHGARPGRRAAVRVGRTGLALPGPGGGHREPLHAVASRAVLLAVLQEAAEHAAEEEPSKAPFYIAAGAARALRRGAVGRRNGPPRDVSAHARARHRALMLVCAVLVAGAMVTAVITG